MNQNLEAFSLFLAENLKDKDIEKALRNGYNDNTKLVIKRTKQILKEAEGMAAAEEPPKDMVKVNEPYNGEEKRLEGSINSVYDKISADIKTGNTTVNDIKRLATLFNYSRRLPIEDKQKKAINIEIGKIEKEENEAKKKEAIRALALRATSMVDRMREKIAGSPENKKSAEAIKKQSGKGSSRELAAMADKRAEEKTVELMALRKKVETDIKNQVVNQEDIFKLMSMIAYVETKIDFSPEQKKAVEREWKGIKREKDEKRKERLGKMLSFRMMSVIDEALAKIPEGERVRIIKIGDGKGTVKEVVQSAKGKHSQQAVDKNLMSAVSTEEKAAEEEMDSIERKTNSPAMAKVYAQMLWKEFVTEYFEGEAGKSASAKFDDEYNKLAKNKDSIIGRESKRTDIDDIRDLDLEGKDKEVSRAERDNFQKLKLYSIMKEIRDFSRGVSKLTVAQLRDLIYELKESHFEGIKAVKKFLNER